MSTKKKPRVELSDETKAIIAKQAELADALKISQSRDRQRAELVAFINARPQLTRSDLHHVTELVRPKPKREDEPVTSKHARRATNNRIGKVLRAARKAAGLTHAQLGEKIGRSGASISVWERGAGSITPDMMEALGKVLDLSRADSPAGFTNGATS